MLCISKECQSYCNILLSLGRTKCVLDVEVARSLLTSTVSGGYRISGRGGLITIFTSGGGYWRRRAPPVTPRGSGGAL